jgi:hypothetical protein
VSPRRGDRAAPPPATNEYMLRFDNNDAAAGWDILCKQAPGNTRTAWLAITSTPRLRPSAYRHHRLKLGLVTVTRKGRRLEQWQYEVTGAGRIWYLVDDEQRTCWVTHAGPGHPKATD